MSIQTVYMIDRQRKQYAATKCMESPDDYVCIIKKRTRTLEQNAILHKIFTKLRKEREFGKKKRGVDEWKVIMVSGHAVATGGESEMTLGIEGEVINLRESTAKMSVKRLSSLLEYAIAWCAENDVRWQDNEMINNE